MNKKTFNLGTLSTYRNQIYGLATIWIMLLHGSIMDKVVTPNYMKIPHLVISRGNVGVDIFLFLSGMGMYYSFSKDSNIRDYTIKRLVRILVPFFVIAGSFFVYRDLYLLGNWKKFFGEITQVAFWAKGNHLVWYIPGILVCYFIYPYLYSFFYDRKKDVNIIKLAIVLVIWIGFTYAFKQSYGEFYNKIEILLTRIPIFIVGSACGKAIHDKKEISALWLIPAAIVSVGALVIIKNCKMQLIQQRYLYFVWSIGLLFVFAFIFSVVRIKALDIVLKWFGKYSLELYLTHILARVYFMKSPYYNGNVWNKWMVILVLCIIFVAVIGNLIAKIQKMLLGFLLKKN